LARKSAGDDGTVAINSRVRVYPGTPDEVRGVIVEDFGTHSGHSVSIGEDHIVDAARRWAVQLDDGQLVFVDSDQIKPE
jgi:hypothetical protein